jgi:hypothetical protein
MAYPIVTLLAPVLSFAMIPRLSLKQVQNLKFSIFTLILLNAVLAIGEFSLSTRLWSVEFPEFGSEFRASALLGHPLSNALILAFLVPFFLEFKKLPYILTVFIVFLGLLATGGRSATVIMLTVLVLTAIYRFMIRNEPMPFWTRTQEIIYIPLVILVIVALGYIILETPIADRILNNLVVDESARARLDVFHVLGNMSAAEWLFGAEQSLLDSLTNIIGITVIENFVIGWIVQFGLIVALPVTISMLYFFATAFRHGNWSVKMGILVFLLVSITNNSLSSKTVALYILMQLVAITLIEKRFVQNVNLRAV